MQQNHPKHPRWDLFVFDWDGTIMDTIGIISLGVRETARAFGLPVPSDELVRSSIGLGMLDTMRRVLPDLPPERWKEFAEAYHVRYLSREPDVVLFDGMERLLRGMHASGLRLAVATGKGRRGLARVFARTGLGEVFEAARTADDCPSKPSPAMLLELSEETGVDPSRMVMVGDSVHDLMMAANAGAAAVGVTYGAGRRGDLEAAAPLALVDDVPALARVLGVGRQFDGS